jgi:DsbC/DsbD-like thiol-disulfide interchange protein
MVHRLLIILLIQALMGSREITSADIVKINVQEVVVYAGKNSVIHVWVEVNKGYHIQANKVNDELLVPTTLKIDDDKNITTGNPKFPPAKKFKLEGTDIFLDVYDGNFEITISIKPAKQIQKEKYILNAKFQYQACDSRSCLSPKTVEFSIPVEVK